jgi:uncharacterized protein (DUF302 family)
MIMKNFWYSKIVKSPFNETVDALDIALKQVGFWILTKIDMKSKLKEKIDKEIEEYTIFWACNPLLAYQALQGEYEIGLLLPCNIIVYERNWIITVSAIVPSVAMNMIDNDEVQEVAAQAEKKLKSVIDSL